MWGLRTPSQPILNLPPGYIALKYNIIKYTNSKQCNHSTHQPRYSTFSNTDSKKIHIYYKISRPYFTEIDSLHSSHHSDHTSQASMNQRRNWPFFVNPRPVSNHGCLQQLHQWAKRNTKPPHQSPIYNNYMPTRNKRGGTKTRVPL